MLPEYPRQSPGLLIEQAGTETLVYHAGAAAGGGATHALNPTARLIWDLCDGAHTLAAIEAALREAFEVPVERDVAADVRRTLEGFQAKGLLAPNEALQP